MGDNDEVDYVLTRDVYDINRINLYHHLCIELFGYRIHPSIDTRHRADLRIADVGTGTGIWLTDLARRLPSSTSLDGLDISFEAAPPRGCLPPNMNLHHYDVLSEVPDALRGVYDVVHVRHLAFVLRENQIEQVVQNLMQLLKPGGTLQWVEADIASFRIEKTDPAQPVPALTQAFELTRALDARLWSAWVPALPATFRKLGLDRVQAESRDAPPYMAMAMHECNLTIQELITRKTQKTAAGEKLQELFPELVRETRNGAFWAFTRWTVVGTKGACLEQPVRCRS